MFALIREDAYYFKIFKSIPNHEYLIKSAKDNVHEHNIVGDLIGTFGSAISYNKDANSVEYALEKD